MPWVDKSPDVLIRRRWSCDDCNFTWETRHHDSADPAPDGCPQCMSVGAPPKEPAYVAPAPAITTSKSRAIALAESMMDDYGLTDMQDNQRVGDIAFKPDAPMHTAEADNLIREMVQYDAQTRGELAMPTGPVAPEGVPNVLVDKAARTSNFWQGNAGGSAESTVGNTTAAAAASRQAAADGVDPVGLLEQGRKSGNMPLRLRVDPGLAMPSSELPQPLQEAQAKRGAMP